MRQQDKYLAIFMVLIMIVVPISYIIIYSGSSPGENTPTQTPTQENSDYNPELWTFSSPFRSISDSLKITPYGVENAFYIDTNRMTPSMIKWVKQDKQIFNEVDMLYNTTSTKLYFANLKINNNKSFLLLNTMSPERNDFNYIVSPNPYGPYYILIRQSGIAEGTYNILGTPTILAPPQTAIDVLNITLTLNKTLTAYDQFSDILNYTQPAPYQIVNSNITFADKIYIGIRRNNNSYERLTVYKNINPLVLYNLENYKNNSYERGFIEYNINQTGSYTIVKISNKKLENLTSEKYT